MAYEQGEWVMHGTDRDDPNRIKTAEELVAYIKEAGFLPLFRNDVPGFSVEERTLAEDWWSEDLARDPWAWREIIAGSGEVAYGKFFDRRAGFVSLDWLPYFANWRRDGYDFDARWDDDKATMRSKKIMDLFLDGGEYFSYEAKRLAGFGKNGEKNFEGTVTDLQMQTYLVIRDFRRRIKKSGEAYGWPITIYTAPETLWGSELLSSAYGEEPEQSKARVYQRVRELFPTATEEQIARVLK